MSDHLHDQNVPRTALIGAAALIVLSVGVAGYAHHQHVLHPPPVLPAVESALVRFEDRPDGSLAVLDAASGREDTVLAPRSNNFIRGVLRGLCRGRKLESLGRDAPFELSRDAEGKLRITDPKTERHVDLDSFGPTNAEAFNTLLVAARDPR